MMLKFQYGLFETFQKRLKYFCHVRSLIGNSQIFFYLVIRFHVGNSQLPLCYPVTLIPCFLPCHPVIRSLIGNAKIFFGLRSHIWSQIAYWQIAQLPVPLSDPLSATTKIFHVNLLMDHLLATPNNVYPRHNSQEMSPFCLHLPFRVSQWWRIFILGVLFFLFFTNFQSCMAT